MEKIKRLIVQSQLGWELVVHSMFVARFIPGANRVFQSLLYSKCCLDQESLCQLAQRASPSWEIKAGPFEGMIYPVLAAAGSMLCPKILGTYESEIAEIFKDSDYLNQFTSIVDIGCAEGYYAVGCGIKTTRPKILAYDTSAKARELCQRMADVNGVSQRLQIKGSCTSADLRELRGVRSLVISDCEGYERELFTRDVVACLAHSDVLIEIHEQFGVDIKFFEKLFSPTHCTEVFSSKTDFEKAIEYKAAGLSNSSFSTVVKALAECRPSRMTWLYARSKQIALHGF